MEGYQKTETTKNDIPPLRREDGTWARSDPEKATTFAKHLQKVFTPHSIKDSASTEAHVSNALEAPQFLDYKLEKITKYEIKSAIKKLNSNKAPGYVTL